MFKDLRFYMNVGSFIFYKDDIKDFFKMPAYKYFTKEAYYKRKIVQYLEEQDLERYSTFLMLFSDSENSYINRLKTERREGLDVLFNDIIEGGFYVQPSYRIYLIVIGELFAKLYSNKKVFQADVRRLNERENFDLDPLLEALPRIMRNGTINKS